MRRILIDHERRYGAAKRGGAGPRVPCDRSLGSFATANIVNNTIPDNPAHGILVTGNAPGFIGFRSADDAVASPNLIRNNGIRHQRDVPVRIRRLPQHFAIGGILRFLLF